MSDFRIIRAADMQAQRWRNGHGQTWEIATDGAGEDWGWRVSIAEVAADAPFSRFEGVEREILLLSGEGMQLHFEDGETVPLLPPHGRHRFPGEAAVSATLVDGATRDFNLMWKRGRYRAELWLRPMVGALTLAQDRAETWLVHVMAGRLQLDTALLEAGDSLLFPPNNARATTRLEGAGSAVFIRLRSAERQ